MDKKVLLQLKNVMIKDIERCESFEDILEYADYFHRFFQENDKQSIEKALLTLKKKDV